MRILMLIFIIMITFNANAKPRYGLRHVAHKAKLNTLRKYASHGKHILKPYKRPHIVVKHDRYKQND
jgi:hypothetical protein